MSLQLAFDSLGQGPPVLILHGLFGSSRNWRSVAQALAPTHRVLCVDLRNHGSSPWADTMGYTEMAADVQALIAAERLAAPTVVGHSMGGKVAMALALQNPAALARLVVVDIAPVSYTDRFTLYLDAMRGLDLGTLGSRADAMHRMAQQLHDPGAVAFLLQNLVLRNDHFDWRLNLMAIHAAVPALSGFPPELLAKRWPGPATLIHGALSDYVRPADSSACTELFPRLQMVRIEGAGHWVHADRPAEFTAALQAALAA